MKKRTGFDMTRRFTVPHVRVGHPTRISNKDDAVIVRKVNKGPKLIDVKQLIFVSEVD